MALSEIGIWIRPGKRTGRSQVPQDPLSAGDLRDPAPVEAAILDRLADVLLQLRWLDFLSPVPGRLIRSMFVVAAPGQGGHLVGVQGLTAVSVYHP